MIQHPAKIFESLKSLKFTNSGDDVDWTVEVLDDEQIVRLVFQETKSKRDWKNNFDIPVKIYKKQESCLRIARGWGNAYKSCNDEIMNEFIKKIKEHPKYNVEICGWSYGGAMAVIAAEDYYFRTKDKANLYTYGAPRPLWGRKTQKYVQNCCNEVRQFAHKNDIVTFVPLFMWGYKHLYREALGKWVPFAFLNPWKYHTCYGDKKLYNFWD